MASNFLSLANPPTFPRPQRPAQDMLPLESLTANLHAAQHKIRGLFVGLGERGSPRSSAHYDDAAALFLLLLFRLRRLHLL